MRAERSEVLKRIQISSYRLLMPLLPNNANAEIDIAKLRDYCLSDTHPRGRHKARVFQTALGITATDASWLKQQLLSGLALYEAVPQENDIFGQRFKVDMLVARQGKRIMIRTVWIVRTKSAAPQFVTCWAL
jgi:hypothetical protein